MDSETKQKLIDFYNQNMDDEFAMKYKFYRAFQQIMRDNPEDFADILEHQKECVKIDIALLLFLMNRLPEDAKEKISKVITPEHTKAIETSMPEILRNGMLIELYNELKTYDKNEK